MAVERKHRVAAITAAGAIVLLSGYMAMALMADRTHDPGNPRSLKNSYLMTHTVEVDLPADSVFSYLTYRTEEVWQLVAEEHAGQRFEVVSGNGLTMGSVIECEEYAEGEGTSHVYVVTEAEENRLIHMASEPSKVFTETAPGEWKEVTRCNCHVYYDLEQIAEAQTRVIMTLVIQMPNTVVKFVTDLLGGEEGEAVWQGHLEEELENITRFMVEGTPETALNDRLNHEGGRR